MDTRYQNPEVTALWGLPWTLEAWWRIEQAVIRAQVAAGHIPAAEAEPMLTNTKQPTFNPLSYNGNSLDRVQAWEEITKHDVAAFLATMREWWGEPHGRWIHFGLTSSDIVDTAQGMRFAEMSKIIAMIGNDLDVAATRWLSNDTMVLGRTHGQPAEPTSVRVRAAHWIANLTPALNRLYVSTNEMKIAKISGPVGTYAHTPNTIESGVARDLGLRMQAFGGSQIVPRGYLAWWANSAAETVQACAKIAMDLRLMALLNETKTYKADGQVGSSAMPHKTNPIRAEKVSGMARLAAGYAAMLQPIDGWLERDLSSSCVERVAVPDLWHVTLHAIEQTTLLLNETQVDSYWTRENLELNANKAWSHHTMLGAIQDGMTYEEAREFGNDVNVDSYDVPDDARRTFMAHYPHPLR